MKKLYKIRIGGLQRKTIFLVLGVLIAAVALMAAISAYKDRMLVRIVDETRVEQQQAIAQTSEETMAQVISETLAGTTALQARIADNDFAEIVNDTYMLQTMALDLIAKSAEIQPAEVLLPDPSLEGIASAKVLYEEGVDYTQSEYLGILAHMSSSMVALFTNSDKIDGCYIGLADGTDLCVDAKSLNKLDAQGSPISFPVRERPWYKGAAESGSLYFTGIITDAFSGLPYITCSAPVIADGELIGVVGIDIILDEMQDFISASSNVNGFACIVSSSGQVVLAPENNGLFDLTVSEESPDLRNSENTELARFIEKALTEATDLTVLRINGREYYAAGSPMPTVGWSVISFVDKEATELPGKTMLAEYDRINENASAQFQGGTSRTKQVGRLVLLVLLVIGILVALYASGKIVNPLEEMTNDIAGTEKTGRFFEMKDSYKTRDEIEVLARAFDELSQKNEQYIEDITEITREKERVSTELNMANQIQNSMLPHIFPAFPNRHEFDIYATMDPAKEVGGDFYDFFLIDDDHLCMVIADVSGKGVPAALFMMVSKVILQSYAILGRTPSEILEKTNTALCSGNQVEMFVTAWLGILEISTGKITAANAGHEYPVLAQNGPFTFLKDKHGFVIGGMDKVEYEDYELHMDPGDRLFLYTDGVPEASDEENNMFGPERLLEALNREPEAAPEQLLENVRKEMDAFVNGAEQFDDVTMLCIEYKGPGPEEQQESGHPEGASAAG